MRVICRLRPARLTTVFSYSVIQHFSREDARAAVAEIGRVLDRDGEARVQMPTRYGIRCLYHQMRRGFRRWRRDSTCATGCCAICGGCSPSASVRARLEVDGYFGIGLQQTDAHLMTPFRRAVLRASPWMTAASERLPWLIRRRRQRLRAIGQADMTTIEARASPSDAFSVAIPGRAVQRDRAAAARTTARLLPVPQRCDAELERASRSAHDHAYLDDPPIDAIRRPRVERARFVVFNYYNDARAAQLIRVREASGNAVVLLG